MARTKDGEVRNTAAEATSQVADAITGLVEKIDVRKVNEVAQKAGAEAKDHLVEYASHGKARASALREHAGENVPAQVESAAGQARDVAVSNVRSPKGRRLLVGLMVATTLAIVLRRLWGRG